MDKRCWCCGAGLVEWDERFDGICRDCGIEETPRLELTDAGRIAADLYRMAESVVIGVTTEPEPEPAETVEVW